MARRRDDTLDVYLRAELARKEAGSVDGRIYSDHAAAVRRLMKAKEFDAAAGLLLRLVEAAERQAAIPFPGHVGIASWYHTSLAGCYAELGRQDLAAEVMARLAEVDARATRSGQMVTDAIRERSEVAGEAPPRRPRRSKAKRRASTGLQFAGQLLGLILGRIFRKLTRRR